MNTFKKFVLPFLLAITLFACNKPGDKFYPSDPEPNGWDQGVQTFAEYVIIKPTWSQSFYFAFKDGYAIQLIAGIILIMGAIIIGILLAKRIIVTKLLWILSIFILLCGGAGFIYSKPGNIKWDNEIRIPKAEYDNAKDHLPALWEDLYYEGRIIGTSGK